MLKALWGYISDKLSIPVSQLSKDNIEAELTNYGVQEALIAEFIGVLNECEYARYAPGNENERWTRYIPLLWKSSVKWKTVSNIKTDRRAD